uniref:Adenine nucleotide translocase lysine methyltransferase n=1 Tax=Canis lupus familiaris TaxID=9615 RepID=A0A8I3Q064_CANLF
MEPDEPGEALTELRERRLGALGLLQAAAGSGLAAYAVWALLLQPGFRAVPLRLQVPYVGASARQVEHVLTLLRGRPGKTVDLGSGDGRIVLAAHRCGLRPALGYELNPWLVGLARLHAWRAGCAGSVRFCCQDLWKVNLRDCHNVSVFLAPSVASSVPVSFLSLRISCLYLHRGVSISHLLGCAQALSRCLGLGSSGHSQPTCLVKNMEAQRQGLKSPGSLLPSCPKARASAGRLPRLVIRRSPRSL